MALCTLAQFQAIYPAQSRKSLTDDTAGETEDTTKVQTFLNYAEAYVYAFLKGRYTTPLTSIPAMLTKITADITFYMLGGRWGESAEGEPDITPYTDAIKMLEAFRDGKLSFYGGDAERTQTYKTEYEKLDIPNIALSDEDEDEDISYEEID